MTQISLVLVSIASFEVLLARLIMPMKWHVFYDIADPPTRSPTPNRARVPQPSNCVLLGSMAVAQLYTWPMTFTQLSYTP